MVCTAFPIIFLRIGSSYLKSPDARVGLSQREEESGGDAGQARDGLAEGQDGPPAPAVHRHQAEDVACQNQKFS